jgi:hypothetical protein
LICKNFSRLQALLLRRFFITKHVFFSKNTLFICLDNTPPEYNGNISHVRYVRFLRATLNAPSYSLGGSKKQGGSRMKKTSWFKLATLLMLLMATMLILAFAAQAQQEERPLVSQTPDGRPMYLVSGVGQYQSTEDTEIWKILNPDGTLEELLGTVNTWNGDLYAAVPDPSVFEGPDDVYVELWTLDGTLVGYANARYLRPLGTEGLGEYDVPLGPALSPAGNAGGSDAGSGSNGEPTGEEGEGDEDSEPIPEPLLELVDFGSHAFPAGASSVSNFGAVWLKPTKALDIAPDGDNIPVFIAVAYEFTLPNGGGVVTYDERNSLWADVFNDKDTGAKVNNKLEETFGVSESNFSKGRFASSHGGVGVYDAAFEAFEALLNSGAQIDLVVKVNVYENVSLTDLLAGGANLPAPSQTLSTPTITYKDDGKPYVGNNPVVGESGNSGLLPSGPTTLSLMELGEPEELVEATAEPDETEELVEATGEPDENAASEGEGAQKTGEPETTEGGADPKTDDSVAPPPAGSGSGTESGDSNTSGSDPVDTTIPDPVAE